MRKLTLDEFIDRSNTIHNNRYNYGKSIYVSSKHKLSINCLIHGEFEQTSGSHLSKHGCPKCVKNKKCDKREFINKANNIHNNLYNYSKSEYVNDRTKIDIICNKHGIFNQLVNSHLRGAGCPNCATTKKKTLPIFIKGAIKIHGYKYDYSKSIYINSQTKMDIICPLHGTFSQIPNLHIHKKQGCPHCINRFSTIEKFIIKANIIHDNLYDYSKSVYINSKTKMDIICPSHGMFKQSSSSHLSKHGCPRCKISRGEKKIEKELIELKIEYISEKTFDGLKSSKNQHLRFDFYLPAINTCIEYDGKQHFESNEYLRGKVGFVDRKLRDNIKNIYCDNNNIKLVRIPYYEFDNIEKIIKQI